MDYLQLDSIQTLHFPKNTKIELQSMNNQKFKICIFDTSILSNQNRIEMEIANCQTKVYNFVHFDQFDDKLAIMAPAIYDRAVFIKLTTEQNRNTSTMYAAAPTARAFKDMSKSNKALAIISIVAIVLLVIWLIFVIMIKNVKMPQFAATSAMFM